MSTYMAKMGETVRKWYILDAAGKPLGKTAVVAADLLRGKRKPEYTPHADCGDNVIIINAAQAVLTGQKGHPESFTAPTPGLGGRSEGDPLPHPDEGTAPDSHARGRSAACCPRTP